MANQRKKNDALESKSNETSNPSTDLTVVDKVPADAVQAGESIDTIIAGLDKTSLSNMKSIESVILKAKGAINQFGIDYSVFMRKANTVGPFMLSLWEAIHGDGTAKGLDPAMSQITFIKKFFPDLKGDGQREAQNWKTPDGFSPYNTIQYLFRQGREVKRQRKAIEDKRTALQATITANSAPALLENREAKMAVEAAEIALKALESPDAKVKTGRDSTSGGTATIDGLCATAFTHALTVAGKSLQSAWDLYQAGLILANGDGVKITAVLTAYMAGCQKIVEIAQRMTVHDYLSAKSIKTDDRSQYQRVLKIAFPELSKPLVKAESNAGTTATIPTAAASTAVPTAATQTKEELLALAHERGEHDELVEYLDDCPTCMADMQADDAVDPDEQKTA